MTFGALGSHSHCNINMTEVNVEDAVLSTNAEFEIKEEIIVKDEIEIGEESIAKLMNTNYFKHSLERVPVVYTTRLEDMLIFKKKFQNLSVDDIVENVILESKPKLSQSLNQEPKLILEFDGKPFLELSEKINQFNKLANLESSKSNKDNISLSESDKDTEFNQFSTLETFKASAENIPFRPSDTSEYRGENVSLGKSEKDTLFNKFTTLETFKSRAENISLGQSDTSESDEENVPLRHFSKKPVDSNADNLPKKSTKPDPKKKSARSCKICRVRLVLSSKVVLFNGKKHLIYDKEHENELTFYNGVLYEVGINCMIVFRDLRRKSVDLHLFGKDGLFSKTINKLDCSSIKMISRLRYLKYTLYVDICCWFYRQHVLNCLIWGDGINSNIFRKAHTCACGKCNCCCKGKYIIDDGVKKLQKRMFDKSSKPGCNNFVNDALRFSRNNILASESITKMTNTKALADVDGCLGVQILKGYSDNMTDYYEINADRNIVKHIEMRSKYLLSSCINFRKATKLNADSDRVFCCWRKRDEMLTSFEFKDISMITQFIRTPHPCPPHGCICCCKPNSGISQSTTLSDKINNLKSSKYSPEHVHNYASVIKRRRQFLAKPKNNQHQQKIVTPDQDNKFVRSSSSCPKLEDFETFIHLDIIGKMVNSSITTDAAQKDDTKKRSVSSGVPSSREKAKSKVCKTTSVEINAKPMPIQTTAATNTTIPVMPALLPRLPKLANIAPAQSNVALPENNMASVANPLANVPIVNNAQQQDATVNSLVNSLLHRFSDVRLIITPDGNVSAEINKPMQNLTTPELQILSKILTHAKEQVKALKEAGHLNSGANTVLNPWPSNLDTNTNLTSGTVAVNMPVNSSPSLKPPSAPSIFVNTNNSLNVPTLQPPGPSSIQVNSSASLKPPASSIFVNTNNSLNVPTSQPPGPTSMQVKSSASLKPPVPSIFVNTNNSLNVPTSQPPGLTSMQVNSSASLKPPAPSKFVNTNNSLNVPTSQPSGPTSSTSSPFLFRNTTNNENGNKRSRLDAFQCYTNLSALKMKEYLTSCKSYLSDVKFAPKIKDVFSLKDTMGQNVPDTKTKTLQGPVTSKSTTTFENIPDPNLNTSGVKRKHQRKYKNDVKKLKTAKNNKNKTTKVVNINSIDPLTEENYVCNSPPIQPVVSPIPIISSMVDNNNMMAVPMVSGLLKTSNVFQSGSVIAPNQLFVAVPLGVPPASGVPSIEVPYAIPGPSTSSDSAPKMEVPYVIPAQSVSPASVPKIGVPFVIPYPGMSPGSVPEMEVPYLPGPNNTEETNDEDCILGF